MSAASAVRRRLDGDFAIDDWGLDADLVGLVSPLLGLRWSVDLQWADRLPDTGPAVLLFNRSWGLSEPFVLSRGVRLATGRHVRSVGVPDVAPVGTVLRRLGGVLDRPDEVAGLLRVGELVALPLARDRRSGRAGSVDAVTVAEAMGAGVPVHPVALVGHELGRHWRVLVGHPLALPAAVGPLAEVEYAEAARGAVQALLDEAVPSTLVPGWVPGAR